VNKLHLYRSHLTHNFEYIKSLLKPKTALVGVVKANAYGAEAKAIAQHLEKLGIDQLAVAYTAEGVALKKAGIQCPIMVFYPHYEELETLLEFGLEPVAYSFRILDRLHQLASTTQIAPYPLHLKFNTGLNRLGFLPIEISAVLSKINTKTFSIKSIYSHLAASEESRPSVICEAQISQFNRLKKKKKKKLSSRTQFHLLNSSGIFNYPEHQFDAVRSGIALYGFANHPDWDAKLKPTSRLTTSILQIHNADKGATVGYNSGWKAPKNAQIATLPLGHADGINRHFGHGQVAVSIHGKKAPILGNVCMDMVMVDVTNVDCVEGDEVEFFGGVNSAESIAEKGGTIVYELLSNIGPRVERIIHP